MVITKHVASSMTSREGIDIYLIFPEAGLWVGQASPSFGLHTVPVSQVRECKHSPIYGLFILHLELLYLLRLCYP